MLPHVAALFGHSHLELAPRDANDNGSGHNNTRFASLVLRDMSLQVGTAVAREAHAAGLAQLRLRLPRPTWKK